jgi:flagellar biosynthesis/type III secretory pathway chaperone
MTIEHTSYEALAEVLEHESRHIAQLIDLLKAERGDLIEAPSERINHIAAEKLNRIQALDTYAAKRGALLAGLGFAQSADGMASAVAASGPLRERMQALWKRVAERAVVARDLNDLNGTLIRARLSNVQGRLAQLQRSAGSETLYGADGLSHAGSVSRPLGNV